MKIVVSFDGIVVKEVTLSKARTTIGRRPYNDIVIENLTVSGEHAVITLDGKVATLEDLHSTNGTYINGQAVQKQVLMHEDTIQIGTYTITYLDTPQELSVQAPTYIPSPIITRTSPRYPLDAQPHRNAAIKMLSGQTSGDALPLVKVVTTIGKPGLAVAAITQRQRDFVVSHVEGEGTTRLNGASIGSEPLALKNGDLIELADMQIEFVQPCEA